MAWVPGAPRWIRALVITRTTFVVIQEIGTDSGGIAGESVRVRLSRNASWAKGVCDYAILSGRD